MVDDNGDGEGLGFTDGDVSLPGNPYVSATLCESYRNHIETKIGSMERKILSSVKLTGAIIAIIMTVVQLGLYFIGG
jgi:hypothetical protein